MAVTPAIMAEVLALPDLDRAELAWRLLESLREGAGSDELDDGLDDEQRAQLHLALQRSMEDARAGRTRPASELIAELRARRTR